MLSFLQPCRPGERGLHLDRERARKQGCTDLICQSVEDQAGEFSQALAALRLTTGHLVITKIGNASAMPALVLACLRDERYGYTLRQALAADGLEMEESTLYPLLRRLESQGLLDSEWREEDKRRKRFYRLSATGAAMLEALTDEWRGISASLNKIIP